MLSTAARIFGPPSAARREYFYVVDLVRGLAALAVVLTHYQHFYYPVGWTGELDQAARSAEPLYRVLWPFYDYGMWAVQIFWGISGFVFANVYAGKSISAKEFLVKRLSRLYPLHLITLFVVLCLQIFSDRFFGDFLIIPNNDLYHFLLQFMFISYWGFQQGHSFNAPIWSVSVELISYALFYFLLPFLFRLGVIIPILVVIVARLILFSHPANGGIIFILHCMIYFFIGVGINHFVHSVSSHRFLLAGSALAATTGFLLLGPILKTDSAIVVPVLVAACLLSAATLEQLGAGAIAQKARFIGDSTYGVYLWHLPIQIVILFVLDGIVGNRSIISSPWFVLFYLTAASLAGWLSFHFIEQPLGSKIRHFFLVSRGKAAASP